MDELQSDQLNPEQVRSLPIAALDLRDFIAGTHQERAAFVQSLGDSFSTIGFAAITGSSLSEAMQAQLFEEVKAFFALDLDAKARYILPDAKGQRGYSQYGSEQAKGNDTPDLKEFWHHGQSSSGQANLVVIERENFTTTLEAVYRALEQTGRDLLRAIALYLKLDEFYFDAYIEGGLSILRPIHYPPITSEPQSAVRAAAHEDINLITLLMGASAEGLEVLRADGAWIPILAPAGYLTINVGDMLQRLTNKRLRSTTHRVVNPPRERWSESRYSVPFFLHPKADMSLACLDSCVSANHPKAFVDMSAGEYLAERLSEIRIAKNTTTP